MHSSSSVTTVGCSQLVNL